MNIATLLEWYQAFLTSAKTLAEWLTTDIITLGNYTFTPLLLLTGSGLATYLVIAIIRWIF